MKIQKGSELGIKNIVMTIYGQPDTGKTTLGLSAKNSLLLDFDGLIYKAKNNQDKDIVQVKNWIDIAKFEQADFANYDTIIIDTCGKALDYLTEELIRNDTKLARRDGALTLQGYGALKSSFTQWLKRILTMGKDIVLLCHVKEKEENDIRIFRPAVVGGSLDEIMTVSTFVGFLHFLDKNRVLDFAPCENWYGKNAAEFETLKLPHYAENNHYLDDIIKKSKEAIMIKNEKQDEAINEYLNYISQLDMLDTAEQFNAFMVDLTDVKPILKKQIWAKMIERQVKIGFKYNKTAKLFE